MPPQSRAAAPLTRRELNEIEFSAIEDRLIAQAPGGLSETELDRWMNPRMEQAIAEAEYTPEPMSGAAGRFISNAAEVLNPVTIGKGIYNALPIPSYDDPTGLGKLGSAVKNVALAQWDQVQKGAEAGREGRWSEAIGHTVAGGIPLIGPIAADIGEQAGSGDLAGAAGKAAGNALLPKVLPVYAKGAMKAAGAGTRVAEAAMAVPGATRRAYGRAAEGYAEGGFGGAVIRATETGPVPSPKELMMRGVKPRASQVKFEEQLDRSMPDLKVVESQLGHPIEKVEDLIGSQGKTGALEIAKRDNRAQYDAMADPVRARGTQVNLSPVADAIEDAITPIVKHDNPAAAAAAKELADRYRRTHSFVETEELLKGANADLEGYYNKFPPQQRSAIRKSDPQAAALQARAQALRDVVYETLDPQNGGAAPRELQRRWGSLVALESDLYRRLNVKNRANPNSLTEQLGFVASMGGAARGVARLAHGDPFGLVDLASAKAMSKAGGFMKEQQLTDTLIKRAFRDWDTQPGAITMPVQRPVRGLLPPPGGGRYVGPGNPPGLPGYVPGGGASQPRPTTFTAGGAGVTRGQTRVPILEGEIVVEPTPIPEGRPQPPPGAPPQTRLGPVPDRARLGTRLRKPPPSSGRTYTGGGTIEPWLREGNGRKLLGPDPSGVKGTAASYPEQVGPSVKDRRNFAMDWLAEDLRNNPHVQGDARHFMDLQNAPHGAMDARVNAGGYAFEPRIAGTPTQEMFHDIGIKGSRTEIAHKVEQFIAGNTEYAHLGPKLHALADAMGEAWTGEAFKWSRVSEGTLKRLGIGRKQFKSPQSVPSRVSDRPFHQQVSDDWFDPVPF